MALKLIKNLSNEFIMTARIGNNQNAYMLKLNSSGEIVWTKNTDLNTEYKYSPQDLIIDNNSNIITTGYFYHTTNQNTLIEKFVTAKYDSSGDLFFFRTYDEGIDNRGYGKIIAVDNENNIYSVGSFSSDSSDLLNDMLILKYDKDGNLLWNIKKNVYGGDIIPLKK